MMHLFLSDDLVSSLRKLVLGGEQYGSRLCLTIDVCSERQAQLILEVCVVDTWDYNCSLVLVV